MRDIAERGMDPEVHGFVEEALPPLNTRIRQDHAFKNNGWRNVYPEASFSQYRHHKPHAMRDIAERGMDPDVNGFVEEALPPLTTRQRADVAYKNNGWKNVYPEDEEKPA